MLMLSIILLPLYLFTLAISSSSCSSSGITSIDNLYFKLLEELMLLNCGVGEDSRESLGLQGDQTSTLKEINPEYSLEGLMLKLKLQYFGHLM